MDWKTMLKMAMDDGAMHMDAFFVDSITKSNMLRDSLDKAGYSSARCTAEVLGGAVVFAAGTYTSYTKWTNEMHRKRRSFEVLTDNRFDQFDIPVIGIF